MPPAQATGIKGQVERRPAHFRRQYDDLERQRAALAARLKGFSGKARSHPAYKRSLVMLNRLFRTSPVARRQALLDAAAWLIGVTEQLTTMERGPTPATTKSGPRLPMRKRRKMPALIPTE